METLSNAIDRVCRAILLGMASVVTVIVIAAVIARYAFNSSFPWSEEVSRALLTWLVFLGATSAYKNREMVAMEALRDSLPDKGVLVFRLISEIVLIAFLAALTYASIRLISLTSRQTFPVTGFPLWSAYIAMPVSAAILLYHSFVRCTNLCTGREQLRQHFSVEELP
jgi:TRAP-type transport system small permease protein